jgi:hypothetical protein
MPVAHPISTHSHTFIRLAPPPTRASTGWALAVSMSRAFGFKQFGGYALAPLIDMADHSPASNAEVRFSADSRRVKLIANKQARCGALEQLALLLALLALLAAVSPPRLPSCCRHHTTRKQTQVPAGAPILLNYGSHDSANLLLSYGFKLPANAADRFRFALDLDMLVVSVSGEFV